MDGDLRSMLAAVPSAPAHATPQPVAGAPAAGGMPRPGWPAKDDLDYVKTLIELALLLLAVPWVLRRLASDPKGASRRAASKVAG